MKTLNESDLEFLISVLDAEDKKELVKVFAQTFKEMMKERAISKTWYYELMNKRAPSDTMIEKARAFEPRIVDWIETRALQKARRVIQIVEG